MTDSLLVVTVGARWLTVCECVFLMDESTASVRIVKKILFLLDSVEF